jgi:protein-S-isoprenylcysteine O-methyltransferase Ste14
MDATLRDTAEIVVFPPAIFLIALAVGIGLDSWWPAAALPRGLQYGLGTALIGAGLIVAAFAWHSINQAATSFDTGRPATKLVTTGPFRYSRNPMYLAMLSLFAGIGVAVDNLWILGLTPALFAIVHYGVIRPEEHCLEARFGAAYRDYAATVGRWL